MTPMHTVIAGVGPGLGMSLARTFLENGDRVSLLARSEDRLKSLARELDPTGEKARAIPVDLTDPKKVSEGFRRIRDASGPVDALIYNASRSAWKGIAELSPEEFEAAWRASAYGAFLACREVIPDMVQRGEGVILFTGATSSIRGRGGALDFSSGKFALRGLSESLARELWPRGIHVAHVVVDGGINTPRRRSMNPSPSEPVLEPDEMAQAYWNLAVQPKSAWTMEIDLRPYNEEFFV